MTPERHQRIKAIFLEACDRPPDHRAAYLDSVCQGDPALRAAVEEHLAADAARVQALDGTTDRAHLERLLTDDADDVPPADHLPTRVGPYRVVRLIAQGGMGAVFEAEQTSPARRVAVKVIRPGLASAHSFRRFEHEVALLGRLSHPGIAQIHEAGVADVEYADGVRSRQRFFAMELVDGVPLTEFASRQRLGTRERLALLAQVCDAVQHAHHKGVVHRDLKPANILVGSRGEGPIVKVLDFGVARALDDSIAASVFTLPGAAVGTIAYMSPEQAAGRSDAVDTRSDVYSLGVVLFELLAGHVPFSFETVPDALRAIRDDEPPRLGTIDARLRGDAETIARKALEKDPAFRYQSPADLAGDIRRFLADEPILARAPRTLEQVRRFVRRNRALVAVAGVAAGLLLAATVFSAATAVKATRAAATAEREADKQRAVQAFLQEMLAAADPSGQRGRADMTVRQAVDAAAANIAGGALADQPEVAVVVETAIGNTYRALGLHEQAEPHLRAAAALGRRVYPQGHADLAQALNKLARLHHDQGRLDDAETCFNEALRIHIRLNGPLHEDVAKLHNNLGWLLVQRGRFDDAETHLRAALDQRRRLAGPVDTSVATSLNNLALLLSAKGDLRGAVSLLRESLDMDRSIRGDLHTNVATTKANLATMLARLGRPDEAEPLLRQALHTKVQVVGRDHPDTAAVMTLLGGVLCEQGELEAAQSLLDQSLEMGVRLHGPQHARVALTLFHTGLLHAARGDDRAAADLLERAFAMRREVQGDRHADTIPAACALARVWLRQGRLDDAAPLLDSTIGVARDVLPAEHWEYGVCLSLHAQALIAQGKHLDAEPRLIEARAILHASLGPDHAESRACDAALGAQRPQQSRTPSSVILRDR